MSSKLKKSNNPDNKGFTIIEVMIVLAIAGLILLIVFLAIPALQRNSRNTQRKADVSRLLGAVSEYQSNHAGALPASGQFDTVFSESTPKLGYYTTPAKVQWYYSSVAWGADAAPPAGVDSVAIVNYDKCANATTATIASASVRNVVAVYNVEGSGGTVAQCQES